MRALALSVQRKIPTKMPPIRYCTQVVAPEIGAVRTARCTITPSARIVSNVAKRTPKRTAVGLARAATTKTTDIMFVVKGVQNEEPTGVAPDVDTPTEPVKRYVPTVPNRHRLRLKMNVRRGQAIGFVQNARETTLAKTSNVSSAVNLSHLKAKFTHRGSTSM
uniref:(northern house mosquito) hypothetical protein n=1 Tax=Culex pipiens TaxID=7175 RepID=A0A8D8AJI1_CULPI